MTPDPSGPVLIPADLPAAVAFLTAYLADDAAALDTLTGDVEARPHELLGGALLLSMGLLDLAVALSGQPAERLLRQIAAGYASARETP